MVTAAIGIAAIAALIGTPALAADMPVKAPPIAPVAAPVYNWTGFYLGASLGGRWSDLDVDDDEPDYRRLVNSQFGQS